MQKYNNFKILVTGSSGMLGSSYINKSSELFDLIITSSSHSNYIYLDITDSHLVKTVLDKYNPNIILNCSAYTNVDKAETNKKLAHSINVNGLENLIKHSNVNTKIVHISTDYIYDGVSGPYFENSLPSPINYYGKTKHEADNILISCNRKSLIFRVNGLFSFSNHNNFFNWVFKSLKNNTKINVVDDQISNPTFVDDLVNIINKSILLDLTGIYNYGTNDFISRYEFAMYIAEYYNLNNNLINPIKTEKLKQISKRPLNSGLICDNIKKVLDIELETIPYILCKNPN